MRNIFTYLLLTLAFAVLLSGCCGYLFYPSPNENSTNLNTTISPARDLTGTWVGPASFQENVEGAQCTITGTFTMTLQQDGNNVNGDFVLSAISIHQKSLPSDSPVPPIGCSGPVDKELPGHVGGTVSSSAITLNMGGQRQFSGSFTSDIMSLKLERCLVNDEPCTLDNSAKWKISLTRNG